MRALLLAVSMLLASSASGQLVFDTYTGTYQYGTYPYSRPAFTPYYGGYGGYYRCDDWVDREIHRSRVQRTLQDIEWNQRQMLLEQRMNQWNW